MGMDMSGNGTIDFDEFLSACLRLQGSARALDLILLTRDSRRFFEQQTMQLQSLQVAGTEPQLPPLLASAAPDVEKLGSGAVPCGGRGESVVVVPIMQGQ